MSIMAEVHDRLLLATTSEISTVQGWVQGVSPAEPRRTA